MANQLFKFNNGYEGIIHINAAYQAAPYFEGQMHRLNVFSSVYKAIEQAGVFRSGLSQAQALQIVETSNLNLAGLLDNNSVMNARQNLVTMLYRMSVVHPYADYFQVRLDELIRKWNIHPKLD